MDIERLKEEIKAERNIFRPFRFTNFRGRAFDKRNRPRVWLRSWHSYR